MHRVANSIGKLLFVHFRVTNWKFKRKMKGQNLDLKVARNSFIEMKYHTI